MKKSLLFLSVLTAISLASCGGNDVDTSKIALDYGYDYKNDIVNIEEVEIGYTSLTNLIDNKESFVLLIFHNRTCLCWESFNPLAVQFMNKYNLRFYAFDNALLEGEDNYGIYRGTDVMPGICFFRRGTLIRQSIYGKIDINHRKFFEYYEDLERYMFDNIYLPKMYYIDFTLLDEKIANNEKINLYIARSGCNDCKAVNRNYLYSWSESKKETTLTNNLYILDIEKYRGTDEYQTIKDKYGLSVAGNPTFGFDTGYIPTFQRIENGQIKDMITVLNDQGDKETGLVTSYFNESRIANSPMLSSAGFAKLDGTTVDVSLIKSWGAIDQQKQYEWHLPAIQLYFDTYVK